ncbi:MAG: GIY-YIG nuclease family protein [Ruminococcus sp.]|nr:GIY-YIG nuclease family protein [Ruminococcus sp.]
MKNYIIYMHKNKINDKVYIGQTCQTLAARAGSDGRRYKGQVFYNAIQKYGWDNFEHIILEDNLTQEEANQKEQEYIKQYNSTNPTYGYNVTIGGDSNTLTEEQKEKRRQLNYQMWADGTFKNIINTAVYCIELDEYFESALEAERKYQIDNSSIQKVCKKQANYAGIKNGQPLHWLYANEITEEKIQQLKNKQEILKGVSIPVYCIELKKSFSSATEAGKILNLDASSIRKTVKGKQKTCGGYHWKSFPEQVNIGVFN